MHLGHILSYILCAGAKILCCKATTVETTSWLRDSLLFTIHPVSLRDRSWTRVNLLNKKMLETTNHASLYTIKGGSNLRIPWDVPLLMVHYLALVCEGHFRCFHFVACPTVVILSPRINEVIWVWLAHHWICLFWLDMQKSEKWQLGIYMDSVEPPSVRTGPRFHLLSVTHEFPIAVEGP